MGPARLRRHPEDTERAILVRIFRVRALRFFGFEPGVLFFESVGNVFEKDQAEDDVFVLRRIHAAPERVCHLPKLLLVADGSTVGGFLRFSPSP